MNATSSENIHFLNIVQVCQADIFLLSRSVKMVVSADMDEPGREDENTEFVGLGCALELFSELDEVLGMIDQLKSIYTTKKATECAYEKFRCVLTLYQEQPHLLDPHLETILGRIISIVRNKDEPIELKHEAFKYLHVIVKVRGYKVVVRHLPHEVSCQFVVIEFRLCFT